MNQAKSLRIVFVGATKFGIRCLESVARLPECNIVGVITCPEVFSISYRPTGVRNVLYSDFSKVATRLGLPCYVMTTNMSDPGLIGRIRDWRPDFILVVGWFHLLPREIRAIAPAAGLHASLLPHYRGGAPLVWAIINDEKRAGVTFFLLNEGVDTGPVIAQVGEPILDTDTIATLYNRIELQGARLLEDNLPRIARGEASYTPQVGEGSTFPQRSPDDGLINWAWEARRVYNFVRAQTRPYPGAYAYFFGERVTIWRVSIDRASTDVPPGAVQVGQAPPRLIVSCGSSTAVSLDEAEHGGVGLMGNRLLGWFERAKSCA